MWTGKRVRTFEVLRLTVAQEHLTPFRPGLARPYWIVPTFISG